MMFNIQLTMLYLSFVASQRKSTSCQVELDFWQKKIINSALYKYLHFGEENVSTSVHKRTAVGLVLRNLPGLQKKLWHYLKKRDTINTITNALHVSSTYHNSNVL